MNFESTKETHMRRSTLILFWGMFFLILVVAGIVIYRVYGIQDYMIKSEVSCDPSREACFARVCTEDCEEGGAIEYYKIEHVNARMLSTCNPSKEDCPELICEETSTCYEELCDLSNVPGSETCNNPEAYRAAHPQEEEEQSSDSGNETEVEQ